MASHSSSHLSPPVGSWPARTRPPEGPGQALRGEKLGCGILNWPVRGSASSNITCRNAMQMQGPLPIFTPCWVPVGASRVDLGHDWLSTTLPPCAASASRNPVLPKEVKPEPKIQISRRSTESHWADLHVGPCHPSHSRRPPILPVITNLLLRLPSSAICNPCRSYDSRTPDYGGSAPADDETMFPGYHHDFFPLTCFSSVKDFRQAL